MADRNGLYIQLFSIHGLIRGTSPELGRDADTGGQVKYVLELARSLAEQPEVEQVDLVTRLIDDRVLSHSYHEATEPLSDKARIVRIRCGGRRYIRKELLWPHLEEFTDRMLKFIKAEGRLPDIVHGHYADGGYVARELAATFGIPLLFTGHSMGRHKKNKLLAEGLSEEEMNRRYRIDYRIGVEEKVIKYADRIITSTRHEIDEQYRLYDNFTAGRYRIIPPGIDLEIFFPFGQRDRLAVAERKILAETRRTLLEELQRFWVNPHKPFILALCRPDRRKNISGLITAYGRDRELQALANLAIFAGIRKDIESMEENEREVLTEMLLLMDRYDLYGKLAIPKRHDFTLEVPELYRLCGDSRGVFVNPALVEPFGLTLIEAASCGVPIVATREGGPADIVANCDNGLLVDPTEPEAIGRACKTILADPELWEQFSANGVSGIPAHYSWRSHCEETLHQIARLKSSASPPLSFAHTRAVEPVGRRFSALRRLVVTDIDNTLVGDADALAGLLELLAKERQHLGWGVATGRCLKMALDALGEHGVPAPDFIVSSVGTEIYYGHATLADRGWQQHLSYRWKPDAIRAALAGLDFLSPQDEETQRPFKISYFMEDDPALLFRVHQTLHAKKLRYNLVYSHGQFLDILPFRGSKGKAIRYLSYKWGLPLGHIMVCGDSGNDDDMLRGEPLGVVVANHSGELDHLRGRRRVYFSPEPYAAGIMDGLTHYKLLDW